MRTMNRANKRTNLPNRNKKLAAILGLSFSVWLAASAVALPSSAQAAASQPAAVSTQSATYALTAERIIAFGKQFIGTPYKFGATSGNTTEFDCSSFTQYVYKKYGVTLPRSSRQQSEAGTYVPRSQLQPGDLIFSDTNRDGEINHVSIYIGNGQLLHTYRVGIGVIVSDFEGSSWDRTYVTARRVIPASEQANNEANTEKQTTAVKTPQQQTSRPAGNNTSAPSSSVDRTSNLNSWFQSWF